MRSALTSLLMVVVATKLLAAPESPKPTDPGALQSITLETGRGPSELLLVGRESASQLLVAGKYSTGSLRDLTRDAKFTVTPADVARVDGTGMLVPLKDGKAVVSATVNGMNASTPILVSEFASAPPVSFHQQIVPIFTKVGCNAGGCHGKAEGQNGFKLSLFGFEPTEDYEYVVKEAKGRRLFPASPENSLLLRKGTGVAPHGGGKKLDPKSAYYEILHRWIGQGSPNEKPNAPIVTRVEVFPKERVMERGAQQQLIVIAHLSDGTRFDATRLAQFESVQLDLAEVSSSGLVGTKQRPGGAVVMVRYQSQVDVFRASVPLGPPLATLPSANNYIDEHIFARLKELGLPPSDLCDDSTFIRRVAIDLTGRLPSKATVETFLADRAANKREKYIDQLLESQEHAEYFANKWSAVLRNRRRAPNDTLEPTKAFHQWIRDSIAQNKPYDQFVREILTVTGEEIANPPVVWFRELKEPSAVMEDAVQLFLGQRIGCAKCHHHPFEKWTQDDYYGMTAFFSKIDVKEAKPAKKGKKPEENVPAQPASIVSKTGTAEAKNPRSGKMVRPTGLGAEPLALDKDTDPRGKLAEWLADTKNPYFAKSLVNRYWKHFLGRGLIDPEDDMRVTNPPSNPALLDALAKDFTDSRFNLKKLVRTICTSRTYQLSAVPNDQNASDRQNFSRFIPKRLNAEVLLDAIDDVTLVKTKFKGADNLRAVQLPDNLFESYFLSVFGRPDASSACECERSSDASLAQALHMFNSKEIADKIAGMRSQGYAKDTKRPNEERLTDLYLVALSRKPTPDEMKSLLAYLEKKKSNPQQAYEDVLWAVLNTKEFVFNH